MARTAARIVSKRLQLAVAAFLCLAAAQLADAIAAQPPLPLGAVRVAIAR